MGRIAVALMMCSSALASHAAPALEGRWEGAIRIPGNDQPVVVDLAPASGGGWTGSIILMGLAIKGAPLANIAVTDAEVSFDMGALLNDANSGPARFTFHSLSANAMAGDMRQAGNVADVALARTGPAQVELPVKSTAVGNDVAREWQGEFELLGYPRHVTITLENHANAAATAKWVIVGKRTTDLPVDLVVQDGDTLRIESRASQAAFEGRVFAQTGEIKGTIELGPLELPVVLRRAGGKS